MELRLQKLTAIGINEIEIEFKKLGEDISLAVILKGNQKCKPNEFKNFADSTS